MKRTTLIAIAIGTVLGTALPGAYAQTKTPADNPPQQGPSAPQTTPPAVGQSGPAPETRAPAVGQAGPNPAEDQKKVERDQADLRKDRKVEQGNTAIDPTGAETACSRAAHKQ